MKITTILLWVVASAGAHAVFAQNGCGSGPPNQVAPPVSTSSVPIIQRPAMLPIRIAAAAPTFNHIAIIDNGRRGARKSAARSRQSG